MIISTITDRGEALSNRPIDKEVADVVVADVLVAFCRANSCGNVLAPEKSVLLFILLNGRHLYCNVELGGQDVPDAVLEIEGGIVNSWTMFVNSSLAEDKPADDTRPSSLTDVGVAVPSAPTSNVSTVARDPRMTGGI